MNRPLYWAVLGLCLVASMRSVGQPSAFGLDPPPAAKTEEKKPEVQEDVSGDSVEKAFKALDQKGRVAQLMLVTLQGELGPSAEDADYLKNYAPGGVILRQVGEPALGMSYVADVRRLASAGKAPVLIGADLYELCRGKRNAASAYPQLPSLLSVGATGDPKCAERLGGLLATQADTLGLDFHFGPSLALAPSIEDATGTFDTLGSDPVFAGEAAQAFGQAFDGKEVLMVPTGFPGGGNNRTRGTPAVLLTPEQLLPANDLLPYIKAIEQGVKMIHVGNTLTPGLDAANRPASQSRRVITGVLRQALRFDGLVIAGPIDDELGMKDKDPVAAACLAIDAGADLLYWQGSQSTVMRVVERLANLIENGQLDGSVVDAAAKRVLAAKFAYRKAVTRRERKMTWVAMMERRDLVKTAYDIERQAITLVRNEETVLPLSKASGLVGIVGTVDVESFRDALVKYIHPVSQYRIATAKDIGDIEDFEMDRVTKNYGAVRTMICVFTGAPRAQGQVRLLAKLKEAGMKTVVVVLGYPRYLPELIGADAILLAYSDTATYTETLRAVADALAGKGAIRILPSKETLVFKMGETRRFDVREVVRTPTGRLPMTMSEAFPAGLSLFYDPASAVKKTEWRFGEKKKYHEPSVAYLFDTPGPCPVTLTITSQKKETYSHTFEVMVKQ